LLLLPCCYSYLVATPTLLLLLPCCYSYPRIYIVFLLSGRCLLLAWYAPIQSESLNGRGGATIGAGGVVMHPQLFQMLVFLLYWSPPLQICPPLQINGPLFIKTAVNCYLTIFYYFILFIQLIYRFLFSIRNASVLGRRSWQVSSSCAHGWGDCDLPPWFLLPNLGQSVGWQVQESRLSGADRSLVQIVPTSERNFEETASREVRLQRRPLPPVERTGRRWATYRLHWRRQCGKKLYRIFINVRHFLPVNLLI